MGVVRDWGGEPVAVGGADAAAISGWARIGGRSRRVLGWVSASADSMGSAGGVGSCWALCVEPEGVLVLTGVAARDAEGDRTVG